MSNGIGKVGHSLLYQGEDGYLFSIGGFSTHGSVGSDGGVFYVEIGNAESGFQHLSIPDLPDLTWAPRMHAGVVSFDGKIWVMGGMTAEGYYDNAVVWFDA